MELASLRLFVFVSQLSSFSKAGVALGMAQPTVSRIIGDLERHFGGQLFYRTGRGVLLTDLGEIALPRAQALVREAEQLTEDVQSFRNAPAGLVTLGLLPSTVEPLVTNLHLALRATFPNIRLRVVEGFSNQIERWLSEGHVDLGLLSRYTATDQRRDDTLLQVGLVLVSELNTAALPPDIAFAEAVKLPLVLPAEPNGLRVLVEDTARRRGLSLNVVLEADSLSALTGLVRRCRYHTILARYSVAAEHVDDILTASAIVDPTLTRQMILMCGQQRPLSRASRVVARTLRAVARDALMTQLDTATPPPKTHRPAGSASGERRRRPASRPLP